MINIQLSNPQKIYHLNKDDNNIEEAIESIFSIDSEYSFLIWNNIFIPLSYKYDISIMIKDIIKIMDFIKKNDDGSLTIHWASNTFASIWIISKQTNNITIKAQWNAVLGKLEGILNENNEVQINNMELYSQFKKMTDFVKNSLNEIGYDGSILEDYYQLEVVA